MYLTCQTEYIDDEIQSCGIKVQMASVLRYIAAWAGRFFFQSGTERSRESDLRLCRINTRKAIVSIRSGAERR